MQRRDFINGMAIAVVAGMSPLQFLYGRQSQDVLLGTSYPPSLLGLRGSNNASYEFAHMLRDGETFQTDILPIHESYDLVVVGAGISGLSAACFYQNRFGKDSKILILDNHDDFGGHARRNEIKLQDTMILSYGGSESFQSPKALYSKEVKAFLASLGVNIENLAKKFDVDFYPNLKLSRGVYFAKEYFGVDKIVSGNPRKIICDDIPDTKRNGKSMHDFIAEFPLSNESKQALLELFNNPKDYLAGMSIQEKERYCEKTSYKTFLQQKVRLPAQAIDFFDGITDDFMALGIDSIPCNDARASFLPGFDKLGLPEISDENLAEMQEPYIYHAADGNASVARLMVKRLIPHISPAQENLDSITLASFDYSQLDKPQNLVKLRLKSTALHVRNVKDGAEVSYMNARDKKLYKVKAKKVVMANYNCMIPYIIPDLPQNQKDALSQNVKTSLLHTKVVLRNWESFIQLGVHELYAPKMPYTRVKLDYPVNIGGYHFPKDPKKPICLHMVCSPLVFAKNQGMDLEDLSARDKARVGRHILFAMSFEEHEKIIRDQLQGMLGQTRFNHKKDILAIVLNRWGHCYSYNFNSLYDDEENSEKIMNLARKPFGNIVIANSDSGWSAYMHTAIEQAHRAVYEL